MLVPSISQKRTLGMTAERFHKNLVENNAHIYQYLKGDERGLTDNAIQYFLLGVVPGNDPEYGVYAGWISIPYITPTGVVDVRFRRPPGSTSKAKYKSLPRASSRIFNPYALLGDPRVVYVCEGEFDAMVLTQSGLRGVAVPGASSWKRSFALALAGIEVVIVCQDGDDAGDGLSQAIKEHLPYARVVVFEGTDVTSYMLTHGVDGLYEKLGVKGNNSDSSGT